MSLPELTLTTEKSQRNVQINQLTVRQSEKGLTLVANIASGDGLPYDLTGLTLRFCENKRDGKAIIDPAVSILDSKNGRISYVLHSQAYACSGSAWFEILNGTTLVDSTQNFSIKVESTTNVNVDSSDYIWDTQLADAVKKAGDIEAQVKDVLDDIQKNPDKYRGVKGDTGTIKIGTVTTADTPSVTNTGTPSDAILNFGLVKGDKGDTGSVDNAGLTTAPAFVNLQTQVDNSAVGTNLIIQSDLKPGFLDRDNDNVVLNGDDFHSDNYMSTNGATVFTLSSPDYTFKGNANTLLKMYDSDKNYLGYQSLTSATQTLSKPNVAYIRLSVYFVGEGGVSGKLSDWLDNHRYKLEKGSVATDWCLNPSEVLTQSDYVNGTVSLNQFGAVGDGQIDDTVAIQTCISYASSNGMRVISDKNNFYLISAPINISKKFDIDLKGSTITSKDQLDSLLNIDCLSDDTAGERQSRLDNVSFDCTNVAVGVRVKARRVYLTNLSFLSVTKTGISLEGGYEISLSSSNFKGLSSNATGISINTTDNFVSHCFGVDCHTFLVNQAEGNVIEGCHSWIWTKSMLTGSIFIDMPSSGLISNCVSDTYETAFRLNPAGATQLISNRVIISTIVYNSQTNNVPPTFISWNGATDGSTKIYKPTIANNWVSFPDISDSGFSKPGNLYNIQPWQLMCELNGNTGNNVPLFNIARTHLSTSSDNITSRTSFALRKGMRVSGIVYCAFNSSLPTSQTVIATLPDGFRPAFQTPAYWIVGTNYNTLSKVAYGWIDQNGDIYIANTSGDNTMCQGLMHLSFDVYQPGLENV